VSHAEATVKRDYAGLPEDHDFGFQPARARCVRVNMPYRRLNKGEQLVEMHVFPSEAPGDAPAQ